MPKSGFLTPKAIGNRQKSKGLQKLRWYCQMCQKQCRDDNGFKCHMMSESHQRQLLLVAKNPGKVIDAFSEEFKNNFLRLLQRRFNTRRVKINVVYQEFIADKTHLHMNATKWPTLTQFVKYLGREGYCTVDETEKGWFIQWIDKEEQARQRKAAKMDMLKKDEEDFQAEMLQQQIERYRKVTEAQGEQTKVEATGLERQSEDEKLSFQLASKTVADTSSSHTFQVPKAPMTSSVLPASAAAAFGVDEPSMAPKRKQEKRKLSNVEQFRLDEEARRAKREQRAAEEQAHTRATQGASEPSLDNWVVPGIVVKIIHKHLADGKYHKKKGVVLDVIDMFTAKVRLLDSKTTLKLDQEFLETVIPKEGGDVIILKGAFQGLRGRVEAIHVDKFCCDVNVREGHGRGKVVSLPYEQISKRAD